MEAKYSIGRRVKILRILDGLGHVKFPDLEQIVNETGTITDIQERWRLADKNYTPKYLIRLDKSGKLWVVSEEVLIESSDS
jgi:hypothetical protein